MSFAATWMDVEIIILSEISQRQISYDFAYMWNLKKKWHKWTYLQSRTRLTDIGNKYDYQRVNRVRDKLEAWD